MSQNFPFLRADAENGPIWDQLFILKMIPYALKKKFKIKFLKEKKTIKHFRFF